VDPELGLGRGSYYWHEVIGCPVVGVDGADLGQVTDIYRVGENDVYVVSGGTVAPFDLPAVRAFIRVFAPRRGEIVVDADSLDLRPARAKAADADRPKAPRRTGPRRKPAGSSATATADSPAPETGPTDPTDPGDPAAPVADPGP
jgi:hypothetical protein